MPSPVAGDGARIAAHLASDPIYAIFTDRSGTLDDKAVAWNGDCREGLDCRRAAPASVATYSCWRLCGGRWRVEPRTGEVEWSVATPASQSTKPRRWPPTARSTSDESRDGQVAVVRADNGEVLHTVAMDDPADGEVVPCAVSAAHGQLFIGGTRKLSAWGRSENAAVAV